MTLSRRRILQTAGAVTAVGGLVTPAFAADPDPRLSERSIGKPDAPLTVIEFYSLTCPHCAKFSAEVMPRIRTELIDTGKIRWVFSDFPLDRAALLAAEVARTLPAERYEPFCSAVLASQDRWAFARGVDYAAELKKIAALAGMPAATFDKVVADKDLQTGVLTLQQASIRDFRVNATPTFNLNGGKVKSRTESGEQNYDLFSKAAADAVAA